MNPLVNITKEILQGTYDSIRGIAVVFYLDKEMNKKLLQNQEQHLDNLSVTQQQQKTGRSNKDGPKREEESKVLKRVLQCCLLNGVVFLFSMLFFEHILLPGIQIFLAWIFRQNSGIGAYVWSWINPSLSIIFGVIWVLPLFLFSRIINSIWFQDIADSAYKFRKGRPQLMSSISKLIADTLFSILVQTLFLLQAMIVNKFITKYHIGTTLNFIHMCLLYALYSFEYKWFNMGWELHKRLTYIEYNWPYFIGFGMPLAILTSLPNSIIVSGCIFSCLFPFFIVSGNEASTPKINSSGFPLKLFTPVVVISNRVFYHRVQKPTTNPSAPSSPAIFVNDGGYQQQQQPSHHQKQHRHSPATSTSSSNSTSYRNSPNSMFNRSSPAPTLFGGSHRSSPVASTNSSINLAAAYQNKRRQL